MEGVVLDTQPDKPGTKIDFIVQLGLILVGIIIIFKSSNMYPMVRILIYLLWVMIAAIMMEQRKQTLKFGHYLMFGVASAIMGIILKVEYQNQHIFPDLGLPGFFLFIPFIILIAALISAAISQLLVKFSDKLFIRLLSFVLANLLSFSLCFFGFSYHFSIT